MNRRGLFLSAAMVCVALALSGCMGKYPKGDFGDKMFVKFDDNQDGYVNYEEYLKVSTKRFEKLDDNDNDLISKEELDDSYLSKRAPFMSKWFEKNDLNKDGSVAFHEMKKTTTVDFKKQDTNEDQKLSKEEMRIFVMKKRFDSLDNNKDGFISQDEFTNSKHMFRKFRK